MRELTPGDLLDSRYRIDEVLGRGGFAVVYRATELATGRVVALKVLTAQHGGYSADQLARFEREVAVIQTLHDPHTVRMYGYGRSPQGAPYAVFEFIDGRDLSEIVRGTGPLPAPVVEHILRQLLAALREAHRKGLVHRDIKPENVIVYTRGDDPWAVKLLDFGIARPHRRDARLTATGELIGTPRYMAPEQLTDAPLSPASDIYSLGVVAVELLFGSQALHGGRWSDQLDRLQSGYQLAPAAVEGLGVLPELIGRMTQRRLEDRLPSAEAALALLDRGRAPRVAQGSAAAGARSWVGWGLAGFALLTVAVVLTVTRREESTAVPLRPAPRAVTPLLRTPTPTGAPAAPMETSRSEPPPAARGCGAPQTSGTRFLGMPGWSWSTYVPDGYDPDRAHPLVVLLHDSGASAATLLQKGGFPEVADAHQFIVVAPGPRERNARDLTRPWQSETTDALLEQLVEHTAQELCVDRRRVFLAAHGDGGRVVRRLSCAGWITGSAIFSHRETTGETRLACPEPQPHLYLAPMHSPHEPREGGKPRCHSAQKTPLADYDARLRQKNQCKGPARPWAPAPRHCETWSCASPYVRCETPGGRTWPGVPRSTSASIGTLLSTFTGPADQPAELTHDACDGPPSELAIAEHMWRFFATLDPLPSDTEPPP